MGHDEPRRGQLPPRCANMTQLGPILGPTWADFGPNLAPCWPRFWATLKCSTKKPEKVPARRRTQRREEARRQATSFLAPLKGAKIDALQACNAPFLPCLSTWFSKRKEGRQRSQHRPRHQLRSKSALESPRNSILRLTWAHVASCWPHAGPKSPQEQPKRGPGAVLGRTRSGPGAAQGPQDAPGGPQEASRGRFWIENEANLGPCWVCFAGHFGQTNT